MQASSGDLTKVEMNAIEQTLNNLCSQSLAHKRDSQKLKSLFQTLQLRLNVTGTNPQFAEIFRYYITEAQIIQNRGYRSTLNESFYTVPLFLVGFTSPLYLKGKPYTQDGI